MTTINAILEELKNVPVNKLEDLYALIRSLKPGAENRELTTKQILAFGGCFNTFSSDDYKDFLEETKRIRSNLFDRDIFL